MAEVTAAAGGKSSPVAAGLGEPTGVELRGGGGAAETSRVGTSGESKRRRWTDGGEIPLPSRRGGYDSAPACMSTLRVSLGERRARVDRGVTSGSGSDSILACTLHSVSRLGACIEGHDTTSSCAVFPHRVPLPPRAGTALRVLVSLRGSRGDISFNCSCGSRRTIHSPLTDFVPLFDSDHRPTCSTHHPLALITRNVRTTSELTPLSFAHYRLTNRLLHTDHLCSIFLGR